MDRASYNLTNRYISIALADIDKAIKLDSNYVRSYQLKSNVYFNSQEWESALFAISKAIQLDSTQQTSYFSRASIYLNKGDYENAIADFSKVITFNPDDFSGYHGRATARYKQENMDASCSDLAEAHRLIMEHAPDNSTRMEIEGTLKSVCDSSLPSYFYQRGIANYNLKRFHEAIAFYTRGLGKFPHNAMMLSFRGNAYMAIKDYKKALPDYDSALLYKANLTEDVDLNSAHTGLDLQQRSQYLNGLIGSIKYSIAEIQLNEGNYEASLNAINEAIAIMPEIKELNMEQYYYLRGFLELILERYSAAVKDFEKCIQINPSFAPGYVNRAVAKINVRTGWKPLRINLIGRTDNVMNAGFSLPGKIKVKDSEETLLAGLADCNKALELNPELEQAFYIRGKIKFALQQSDYCYDLLKAKTMGVVVEPELLNNCGNR